MLLWFLSLIPDYGYFLVNAIGQVGDEECGRR